MDKVEIELLVEEKILELLYDKLEICVSKEPQYGMAVDEVGLEVSLWWGNQPLDKDQITIKD